MRLAAARSSWGWTVWSLLATMYQLLQQPSVIAVYARGDYCPTRVRIRAFPAFPAGNITSNPYDGNVHQVPGTCSATPGSRHYRRAERTRPASW
jgi:hypothetical protein